MSTQSGSIRRSESGDVEVKVNVYRNGQKLQSSDGADDIYDFITFQFIRLSEYQELIFTFYLYNHALFFKKIIYFKT